VRVVVQLSSLLGGDGDVIKEASECLEREAEPIMADCLVLPSLNAGGIESVSEKLPSSTSFASEDAFRKYWTETVGLLLRDYVALCWGEQLNVLSLASTAIYCLPPSTHGQRSKWG
jgi:hypothetical protein